MKNAIVALFVFMLLSAAGCGGRGPDMPPEQIQARTEYLRDIHEYYWDTFDEFRGHVQQYIPGSQPFRDEYMMMLEARDRARSSGRDYLQFLESLGRHARAERARINARLDELDRLEQDIPYR